jgi:hypothetical protein
MCASKRAANSCLTRVGWMLLIYLGSVAALVVIATLFKLLMAAAGLRAH